MRSANEPTSKPLRLASELPPPEHTKLPETPYSHGWERVFEPRWQPPQSERQHRPRLEYVGPQTRLPDTDLQAMMEAPPHEEPMSSKESTAPLRDVIATAIDQLDERSRWIFEARYYRGMSVREVASELNLSKSYVDRIDKAARARLRDMLIAAGIE